MNWRMTTSLALGLSLIVTCGVVASDTGKEEKSDTCAGVMGVGYKAKMIEQLCRVDDGVSQTVTADYLRAGCRHALSGDRAVAAAKRVKAITISEIASLGQEQFCQANLDWYRTVKQEQEAEH